MRAAAGGRRPSPIPSTQRSPSVIVSSDGEPSESKLAKRHRERRHRRRQRLAESDTESRDESHVPKRQRSNASIKDIRAKSSPDHAHTQEARLASTA
eukprot:1640990-Pyramimonas_sp.AAC.1